LTIKRAKATLLTKRKQEKEKELENINKSENEKLEHRNNLRDEVLELQSLISKMGEDINQISKSIQQATGLEQENLHTQIANLRAEIEGLKVRKEGYENRKNDSERRVSEMNKTIPAFEFEIKQLKENSPIMAQKAQELKIKKDELATLEEEKKKVFNIKSELNALRERSKDREQRLGRVLAESESVIKQLEDYQRILSYKNEDECVKVLGELRKKIANSRKELENIGGQIVTNEKQISVAESEIFRADNIMKDVSKIDTCPLCQSKITEEHIKHVNDEQERILLNAKKIVEESKEKIRDFSDKRRMLNAEIKENEENVQAAEIEHVRHRTMKDKNEQLKRLVDDEKTLRNEIAQIESRRKELEEKSQNASSIEERYENKILEIEEISSRTSEDTDTRLLYKQRDLEQMQVSIKIAVKGIEELKRDITELQNKYELKQKSLDEKDLQEKELQHKFKKLFEEREQTQRSIQEQTMKLNELNNNVRAYEDQINYLKIGKAKLDAEKEALEMELNDYFGIEIIQGSVAVVEERLQRASQSISEIGSINLRALEVYDEVKKEYDVVQEKALTIEKEKTDILQIVAEIDTKKRKSFVKTFRAMSDLFSQNFSQLYSKGVAFLELENKEDIFAGGVNIVVRLAKGKYFDVTSLSGGEQTLVALSLLFAIQEYKPYHFYVLDEIDAALDKRNSERLAGLLVRYMKSGQYIIITHNDAIIMNANVLYGVSMHDGVSKVLSLNLEDTLKAAKEAQQQEEAAKQMERQAEADTVNTKNDVDIEVIETRDVKVI
ncbi:MAG: AAA family ATPase, partial [Nanoarchaeota archaeon]